MLGAECRQTLAALAANQGGFNGAAPCWARSGAIQTAGELQFARLQRSRALLGAECTAFLALCNRLLAASTEPRLVGRGVVLFGADGWTATVLQRSRALLGAECQVSKHSVKSSKRLQRSRALLGAE